MQRSATPVQLNFPIGVFASALLLRCLFTGRRACAVNLPLLLLRDTIHCKYAGILSRGMRGGVGSPPLRYPSAGVPRVTIHCTCAVNRVMGRLKRGPCGGRPRRPPGGGMGSKRVFAGWRRQPPKRTCRGSGSSATSRLENGKSGSIINMQRICSTSQDPL